MWNIRKLVKKGDYLYAVVPEHPNAIKYGYVLAHRVEMENHLGRLLNANEIVHHKDGNKFNNQISNLEVMTNTQHVREHSRSRGCLVVELKCPNCGVLFVRRKGLTTERLFRSCSKSCRGAFSRKIQLFGRTQEVEIAISENIVREFRRFLDNSEETVTTGSVETTRDPSVKDEEIVQPTTGVQDPGSGNRE